MDFNSDVSFRFRLLRRRPAFLDRETTHTGGMSEARALDQVLEHDAASQRKLETLYKLCIKASREAILSNLIADHARSGIAF